MVRAQSARDATRTPRDLRDKHGDTSGCNATVTSAQFYFVVGQFAQHLRGGARVFSPGCFFARDQHYIVHQSTAVTVTLFCQSKVRMTLLQALYWFTVLREECMDFLLILQQ